MINEFKFKSGDLLRAKNSEKTPFYEKSTDDGLREVILVLKCLSASVHAGDAPRYHVMYLGTKHIKDFWFNVINNHSIWYIEDNFRIVEKKETE